MRKALSILGTIPCTTVCKAILQYPSKSKDLDLNHYGRVKAAWIIPDGRELKFCARKPWDGSYRKIFYKSEKIIPTR